jgi:hypothetical protein
MRQEQCVGLTRLGAGLQLMVYGLAGQLGPEFSQDSPTNGRHVPPLPSS